MTVDIRNPEKNKPVTLTQAAISHIKREIKKRGAGIGFRLYLSTAGCSGMMYKINIIDEVNPNDACFDACDEFKIYVDNKALPYVQGTEIDFVKDGINHIFKYKNPNETGSCGCGESFTIDDRFKEEEI